MSDTVTVQGFTITAPSSPTGMGGFITSPTTLETVSSATIGVVVPSSANDPWVFKTVEAQFQWVAVYQAEAEDAPASQTVAITTGVTSTTSETSTFSESIGLEENASLDGIGTKLSESFTESESVTTTIALTDSTTVSNTYQVPEHTTGQFWQRYQVFNNVTDGTSISQQLSFFLALTYPST